MKMTTRSRHRQKGISTWGWLGLLGIFGLLIVSFFKVFPFYYDSFKVRSALEALSQDTSIDPKSRRAIWESLQKRLFIDEVKYIKREHVTMNRKDGKTTVTISYQVENDYIANLYIGARFTEQAVIDL